MASFGSRIIQAFEAGKQAKLRREQAGYAAEDRQYAAEARKAAIEERGLRGDLLRMQMDASKLAAQQAAFDRAERQPRELVAGTGTPAQPYGPAITSEGPGLLEGIHFEAFPAPPSALVESELRTTPEFVARPAVEAEWVQRPKMQIGEQWFQPLYREQIAEAEREAEKIQIPEAMMRDLVAAGLFDPPIQGPGIPIPQEVRVSPEEYERYSAMLLESQGHEQTLVRIAKEAGHAMDLATAKLESEEPFERAENLQSRYDGLVDQAEERYVQTSRAEGSGPFSGGPSTYDKPGLVAKFLLELIKASFGTGWTPELVRAKIAKLRGEEVDPKLAVKLRDLGSPPEPPPESPPEVLDREMRSNQFIPFSYLDPSRTDVARLAQDKINMLNSPFGATSPTPRIPPWPY
jgi:hypothetical protein